VPELPPAFSVTGIGSLPHTDPDQAVQAVVSRLTQVPYWPQLPRRSPAEDMNLQYAPALEPLVGVDLEGRRMVAFSGMSREEALAGFYERAMAATGAQLAPTPEQAAGLWAFVERIKAMGDGGPQWVKGHVTGPCTLAGSVKGLDGKALLYDEEVADAIAMGLGAAAAAQAEVLATTGRKVIIFFDEPFLAGFGSAFTPITRERVVALLSAAMAEAKGRFPELTIGIHCCANTDWSMIIDSGVDILNLDSEGYGEHLLLYPEAVSALLERGGAIAWGAVPTSTYTGTETTQGLWEKLKGQMDGLVEKGIDRGLLSARSFITPSCGMGSLTPSAAERILDLSLEVASLAKEA